MCLFFIMARFIKEIPWKEIRYEYIFIFVLLGHKRRIVEENVKGNITEEYYSEYYREPVADLALVKINYYSLFLDIFTF